MKSELRENVRTVKVRVALVVNEKGDWAAQGWSGESEAYMLDLASELLHKSAAERTFWLTAELPLPEVDEVAAKVEGAT